MRLVWQWVELERRLPPSWTDAHLALTVREPDAARAAALLGSANVLRRPESLRLFVSRTGGLSPDALRRALLRLDRERIEGTLELAAATEAAAVAEPVRTTLAGTWTAALATLPGDWSDLHGELALRSSDHLERAALLVAPLNPTRVGTTLVLAFRAARRFGYGASATMVRRCLERLDEEGIPGETRIVRALCDTHNVATQGPVWRVGGRSV